MNGAEWGIYSQLRARGQEALLGNIHVEIMHLAPWKPYFHHDVRAILLVL